MIILCRRCGNSSDCMYKENDSNGKNVYECSRCHTKVYDDGNPVVDNNAINRVLKDYSI